MTGKTSSMALLLALAAALAATNCSAPDLPRYGSPNSLQGKSPPAPPAPEESPTQLPCGGKGFIKDEPPCAVKWSTDIFPLMKSNGNWRCAEVVSCHGGTIPPKVTDNSEETWDSLRKFPSGKGFYINPCSKDKGESGLSLNLSGTQVGSQMPKPPGTPASTEQLAKVDAWLACGSPKN